MVFDLALGLGKKTKVPFIAKQSGRSADCERTHVPQRIERTEPPAEFFEAVRGPGEMIGFLRRRLLRATRVLQDYARLVLGLDIAPARRFHHCD